MATSSTSESTPPASEPDGDDSYELVDNTDSKRFELHRDGELLSHAEYTDNGESIFLPHVFTLPQHRGNGNAGRLMDLIIDHARATGRTITPICPFAVQHIADNPEYADLVA